MVCPSGARTDNLERYRMSDSETAELSREWRTDVRSSISALNTKMDQVLTEVSKIRAEFVPLHRYEALVLQVRSLEQNQSRFMGGILILNFVGGIALAIILKIWK